MIMVIVSHHTYFCWYPYRIQKVHSILPVEVDSLMWLESWEKREQATKLEIRCSFIVIANILSRKLVTCCMVYDLCVLYVCNNCRMTWPRLMLHTRKDMVISKGCLGVVRDCDHCFLHNQERGIVYLIDLQWVALHSDSTITDHGNIILLSR